MTPERPTFPETYRAMETGHLLDVYARGPERLHRALDGLSDDALRARPIQGKWSVLEIAVHVADSEMVGAVRIRMVLAGPGEPVLPGYDQDRWSQRLGYRDVKAPHLARALESFAALRAATLPLLAAASPDDWSAAGIHPGRGRLTLRNLLELYADHSERHIEQIVALRGRLGTPVELEALLPERLY